MGSLLINSQQQNHFSGHILGPGLVGEGVTRAECWVRPPWASHRGDTAWRDVPPARHPSPSLSSCCSYCHKCVNHTDPNSHVPVAVFASFPSSLSLSSSFFFNREAVFLATEKPPSVTAPDAGVAGARADPVPRSVFRRDPSPAGAPGVWPCVGGELSRACLGTCPGSVQSDSGRSFVSRLE